MTKLNYLTNAKGKRIAVQIPIEDWILFQKQYEQLKLEIEKLCGTEQNQAPIQIPNKQITT
ncbi:MAG: hypothetical protein IPN94_04635 [Sphingobacteriales bacterium]|nr:hypothetical protein [Sphingobacteriales bacterium]